MKPIAATAALLIIATASAVAQEAPGVPRTRHIPQQPSPRPTPAPEVKLAENVTVQLKGNIHGLVPLDISLSGTGPQFQTETMIPATTEGVPATIISIIITVAPREDDRFDAEYSIGARIPIAATARTRVGDTSTTSYSYHDVRQAGTVILTKDKVTAVSVMNGEALTLQISGAE